MSGSGLLGILMLALSAGSVNATDWMTMVQPLEYFKSRNIDPTLDRLIDFAIADIDSAKAQIRQLAALQHFTNEAEKFKSAKNYDTNRMAIEEVAEGKRGKDPAGFGQEYAKRLLAKLDRKKQVQPKYRPLRRDALNWFPADLKLALAFDMHQLQDISNDTRKGILTTLSDHAKFSLYDQLETSGNLRVDRMAFGVVDAEKAENQKTFVRISGNGNQAWIANALSAGSWSTLEAKKSKDADGTPIVTLYGRNAGAVIVLVGNTEMIVGSYHQFDGRHEEVIAELLAVRAKQKPAAEGGVLKDRLAKIPDNAIGFLVGDLPGELKEEVRRLIDPIPTKFAAYVERTDMGLDVKAEVVMKDGAAAGKFVAKVGALRKDGIKGLQQALNAAPEPGAPGIPPLPLQSIIKLVETVQVQNDAERVQIRGFVGSSLIQQLGEMYVVYNNGAAMEAPRKNVK